MTTLGKFGRYREVALLGQGGMARVVLAALDGPAGSQKLLVVKEMLPELAIDPEFVTMFTDEARLALQFDHPNIVQTFELVEDGGRYFFVMEYLDGQPWSAITARQRTPPLPIALRIFVRLLSGLHYAHELCDREGRSLGVVHRDVSPHNVFVGYSGGVKLVDFGIAKTAEGGVKTRTGVFKGKISYAAPEQLENLPLDRRADLFAVGVMLWEVLAGRRITKGMSEAAIVTQRLKGDPDLASVAPNISPKLAAICGKAMAHEREGRYETAAEMRTELEAAIAAESLRATDDEIGAYVGELFAEERTQTRRLVQERITASSMQLLAAPPLIPHPSESASDTARLTPPNLTSAATDMTRSVATIAASSGSGRKGAVIATIAGAVAAVVLTLGVVVPMARRGTPPAPVQAASTTEPPAADEVGISIVVSPADSEIVLEGTTLGRGRYTGSRPKRTGPVTLVVRAPGFKTAERVVTLDRDVHLELSLEPEPKAATSNPAASPPKAPVMRPTGPKPHAKPIDTSDPYGQNQ